MSSTENAFINSIPLDLASISPDNVTSTSLLHGIITIKWPYSSSSQKLTFLLADPDPRKRASGGQVKITLLGEAAEILDQTESGESVSLSTSTGATVESEPEGQRAKWHITFPEGCILQIKDNPPRTFAAPIPTQPIVIPSLPRIPTPPPNTTSPPSFSASSTRPIWKTPLKRKFSELTDHSITTLNDEEEWFGTEPRISTDRRRFSGRMRFIDPNSSTPSSPLRLPSKTPEQDENSFLRDKSVRRGGEEEMVLRAQNLVSAEILKEKLSHPPQTLGTEDVSRMAVVEESRPVSASGDRSRQVEKSFDVFRDQLQDVGGEMESILPPELTRVGQSNLWSATGERRSPGKERSPGRVEEVPDEEPVMPRLQITEEEAELSSSESVSSDSDFREVEQEEGEELSERQEEHEEETEEGGEEIEDDDFTFDASGQLVQPTERRYFTAANESDSDDQLSAIDGIDYGYPEHYADDEELSGEEYEAEEEAHHAGYYSRDRRDRRDEEEYYHSDEDESYSEEEEQEESTPRQRGPVMVDLTLDSDEEEPEQADEQVKQEGEESDEESEEEEEEMDDDSSWQGIPSATPLSQATQATQQPPETNQFDFLLDPTLMAPLQPHMGETQPHPFTDVAQEYQATMFPQPVQSIVAESALDPSLLQAMTSQPMVDVTMSETIAELPIALPREILDMAAQATQPQGILNTFSNQFIDIVDPAAAHEFLTGLLPMTLHDQDLRESVTEMEPAMSEFLPNIVPGIEPFAQPRLKTVPSVEVKSSEAQIQPAEEQTMTMVTEQTQQLIVQDGTTTTRIETEVIEVQEVRPAPSEPERPTVEPSEPREPSPPPIPETWPIDGLETNYAYYFPLATITPPSLRAQKENRDYIDLIGVVREIGQVGKTKGPDYVLPLHLVDPSIGSNNGLSVLIFRPNKSALPVEAEVGTVMICSQMKVQSHKNRPQTRTTEASGWVLFRADGSVVESGPPVEYGEQEVLMVRQFQHWWKRVQEKGKGKENVSNGSKESHNEANGVGK